MLTATLFIMAKNWEQPKHPFTLEQINYVLSLQWNSKEQFFLNELLLHATWMNLNQLSWTKEDKHKQNHTAWFPLYKIN